MRSQAVSVLGPRQRDRGRLHWLRHERFWLLAAGNGTIARARPAPREPGALGGRASSDRDRHALLARDVDLGYAHGIAEDHVRQLGARRLADPSAAWRRAPISDAQRALLARLRIPVPEHATKGDASDLIALHHGARRLEQLSARRAA